MGASKEFVAANQQGEKSEYSSLKLLSSSTHHHDHFCHITVRTVVDVMLAKSFVKRRTSYHVISAGSIRSLT